MGCFCKGCCKALLLVWSVFGLLVALGVVGMMAFKLQGLSDEAKMEDYALNEYIVGLNWYSEINYNRLNKFTWYTGLGIAALMFIASIIHIISTCKSSRCLLGLSAMLLTITLAADILGIVFRAQTLKSMEDNLDGSLNQTIVDHYNFTQPITNAWNNLGKKGDCCGLEGSSDFKFAKYWNGSLKAKEAPCGEFPAQGCRQTISYETIHLHDIWLYSIFAIKAFFSLMILLHTCCVCKYGMGETEKHGYGHVESYSLQRKK